MKRKQITKGILIVCAAIGVLCGIVFGLLRLRTKELPDQTVFAILPDTQLYSQFMPEIFDAQTQWIADHAEKEDIAFVLHVGDITNKAYIPTQWENASHAMSILDENSIPYVTVTGNHDVDDEASKIDLDVYYDDLRIDRELYPIYFSEKRFSAMATFGGMSENGYNQYHFISCGDGEIMVLALDWMPSEETMDWVQTILSQYPNTPTIVVKHDFIQPRKDRSQSIAPANEECSKQWEIFSQYDQIFMIINGHYTGSDHGILKNQFGNDVYVAVIDYQGKYHGGNGWMRLLTLDFAENTINGVTFSPYVMTIPEEARTEDDIVYLDDEYNEFQFPFDLRTRFTEIWN